MDLLDDPSSTNSINLPRLNNLKPTVPIMLVITQPTKRRPDPSMNISIIPQQPLLMRVVKVGSVVNTRLFSRTAAENFRFPGIEMGVEVDDGYGAVSAVHASEEREGDGVVASECYDARKRFAVFRDPEFAGVGRGVTHEDAVVAFFDLVDRPGVVVAWFIVSSSREIDTAWLRISYDVTGISPQSSTFAHELNGLAAKGTL